MHDYTHTAVSFWTFCLRRCWIGILSTNMVQILSTSSVMSDLIWKLQTFHSVSRINSSFYHLFRVIPYTTQTCECFSVIGELGMHGMDPQGRGSDRVLAMRAAQHSVTLLDEFRDNTLFVRTAPYVVSNGTSYNGGYHYYGRADTYFHIGKAFGDGMLQLLGQDNSRSDGESLMEKILAYMVH